MELLFFGVFLLWNFLTYTYPYQPSSMNNIERTGIKDDKKMAYIVLNCFLTFTNKFEKKFHHMQVWRDFLLPQKYV